MFQKAAGYILLGIGILFGIFILVKAAGSREEVRAVNLAPMLRPAPPTSLAWGLTTSCQQ